MDPYQQYYGYADYQQYQQYAEYYAAQGYQYYDQNQPEQPATDLIATSLDKPREKAPVLLSTKDYKTVLFISHIPATASDEIIEKVLEACGQVRYWEPMKDGDGVSVGSGFCVYENEHGAIRALMLLGGYSDQLVPKEEGEEGFLLSVEESTLNHLKSIAFDSSQNNQVEKKLKELFEIVKSSETSEFYTKTTEKPIVERVSKPPTPAPQPVEEEEEEEEELVDDAKDEEKLSLEKEAKFLMNEAARLKRIATQEKQLETNQLLKEKQREKMAKRLQEFNDEEDQIYADKSRWRNKRSRDLEYELEKDRKDREAEGEEMEFSQENIYAERRFDKEESSFTVTRIMTKEERMNAIKDLVAQIPADEQGLFTWNILWESVDDTITEKLTNFVSKKLVEAFQEEPADIKQFIMQQIQQQTQPQKLVQELTSLMEDEASVFVMKLWRMLIYETEARAKGL